MTQRTKCTCQLVVGIAGAVMGVAAWATAGHMALLGNWLPASITMCAAAWMMSVSETAFDRMLVRRLKQRAADPAPTVSACGTPKPW